MKLSKTPTDGKLHTYCLRCRRETVRERPQAGRIVYACTACSFVSPRALIIDPAINWWLGQDGEYWHETAGVFVHDRQERFLFLERAKFPFGLTIPAGHVDHHEQPLRGGYRELGEEAGFHLPMQSFRLVVTENILGDQCRRGSDAHRWHAYVARMRSGATLKVNTSESVRAVWLGLDQALSANLTFAVRSLIVRHRQEILRAAR